MDDKLLDVIQNKDLINTGYLRIPIVSTESVGLCPPLPDNPYIGGVIPSILNNINRLVFVPEPE